MKFARSRIINKFVEGISIISIILLISFLGIGLGVSITSNSFASVFVILMSTILAVQGLFTLFWMLYAWEDPDNYYTQNWAWFATALYSDNLPNLWK